MTSACVQALQGDAVPVRQELDLKPWKSHGNLSGLPPKLQAFHNCALTEGGAGGGVSRSLQELRTSQSEGSLLRESAGVGGAGLGGGGGSRSRAELRM